MKQFIVYSLYNTKHDKIYIGQTDNVEVRLEAHKDKRFNKSYTARFDGDWQLIYKELVPNRSLALKREKELKSYKGREFIKKHINPR
ncbi:MAG: GIY-YIG nuclease family protein [bacterium]|nr:GIY-YIG nuclease family protein [bacterium]